MVMLIKLVDSSIDDRGGWAGLGSGSLDYMPIKL